MIWIDSIYDLEYYRPQQGVPCYCDAIVFPSDMVLQGVVDNGTSGFDLTLYVYSADGLTQYEDATDNFEYYFAQNPVTLETFFNARLLSFTDAMCLYKCFIIRAVATRSGNVVFDKYTERYCQTNCCDLARNITIRQASIVGGGTTATDATPKYTDCGERYITLRTSFDCYDKFLGNYFGIPPVVYDGTATFGFENVTTLKGRIVRKPRDIQREYSYNCRLQRAESKPIYRFEGFELFPAWKMNEIEAQLHATTITIEGRQYEYAGGTAFTQPSNCLELFKLDTIVEDCMIRQVFGCDTSCGTTLNYDNAMKMFVIPDGYNGGSFYDESGVLIAEDYEGLLTYIRSLDGIYELNDYNPVSGIDCSIYAAFSISGTGYIPTSFYYDSVVGANRVFGAVYSEQDEICGNIVEACAVPVIGTITVDDVVCDDPVIGTITVSDVTPTELDIVGYGTWTITDAGTDAVVNAGVVSMNLEVNTTSIVEDPDNPGDPVYIFNQVVAVISAGGRPAVLTTLDSTNSGLPSGAYLTIDINGFIYYQGYTTTVDDTSATVAMTNLNYNL